MQTRESIFSYLQEILVDLFEVDPEAVSLTTSLYEDLDIDSIDAVDMIVKLKEFTGKKIRPSDFKKVRTVEDVVEAVYLLLYEEEEPAVLAANSR